MRKFLLIITLLLTMNGFGATGEELRNAEAQDYDTPEEIACYQESLDTFCKTHNCSDHVIYGWGQREAMEECFTN